MKMVNISVPAVGMQSAEMLSIGVVVAYALGEFEPLQANTSALTPTGFPPSAVPASVGLQIRRIAQERRQKINSSILKYLLSHL